MSGGDYRAGEIKVHRLTAVRKLRADQTDAERLLWQRLRASQLAGHKFRRQHEFGGYVLDFYCVAAKLAVEVDGGQHLTAEGLLRDAQRSHFLELHGIRVLRLTNTQVLVEIELVLDGILEALSSASHE
jgi:very-short-patch-repair endonuclease